MLELLNSLVRLSAAVTVYGMQEVQSAAGSVHPEKSVDKLREMIDSLANSVSSKIDDRRRPMLDSFAQLGHGFVDRTGRTVDSLSHTLNVPSMMPRDIMQSTSDAVKTTSDWLGGIVKPEPAVVVHATIVEETVIVA